MSDTSIPRRDFIKQAAIGTAAFMLYPPARVLGANDRVRVGMIGVGGRGSELLKQITAVPNVELVAMADMFKDKLDNSLSVLQQQEIAAQVDVKPDMQFVGWDAYKGVVEHCDVVLLATPPHFRPIHLKAVAEAGKHCFC